jgi:hypothetical protein
MASMKTPSRLASLSVAILLCTILFIPFSGCFSSREEVSDRSPREWTKEECLTAVLSSTATNIFDKRTSIRLIAVPYFPSVVEAIVRLGEIEDTVDTFESKYKFQLNALLKSGSGLYYDWEKGKYFSPKGRYFNGRTDIDSLLFLVTLMNTSWPCISPKIFNPLLGPVPIFSLADMPCYTPALDSLDRRIVLRNEHGEQLSPKYVWGKANANLTTEEDLFVMFDLSSSGDKHFLRDGEYVYFELTLPGTFIQSPVSLKYAD